MMFEPRQEEMGNEPHRSKAALLQAGGAARAKALEWLLCLRSEEEGVWLS